MNDRAKFVEPTDAEQTVIDNVREAFSFLYDMLERHCKYSRETNLALARLEEAQMWAIKGITRER